MKLVMITGERRSGTTLLANYLNGQESIVIYADFLRQLSNRIFQLGIKDLNAPLNDRQANILRAQAQADAYAISVDVLHNLNTSEFNTANELYKCIFERIEPNAILGGFKSTVQYNIIKSFLESGNKVIFCIRDPRDIILSSIHRFSDFNLNKFINNIDKSLGVVRKHNTHSNFYTLKFEKLVEDPSVELSKLSGFLDYKIEVDGQPKMRQGLKFTSNSSFNGELKVFDPKAINRWKSRKENYAIKYVEAVLSNKLVEFGYKEKNSVIDKSFRKMAWMKYRSYQFKQRLRQNAIRLFNRLF